MIAVCSSLVGLLMNHLSPTGIPVFMRATAPHLPLPQGVTTMALPQVRAVVGANSMLVLDARSAEEYAAGHIPGALSLPLDAFEERFLDLAEIIGGAPEVLVYCASEDCGDGAGLADRLREACQGRVYLFEHGWRKWSEAGYAIAKGNRP
jgi:rhodanese-related sulfurtransferase